MPLNFLKSRFSFPSLFDYSSLLRLLQCSAIIEWVGLILTSLLRLNLHQTELFIKFDSVFSISIFFGGDWKLCSLILGFDELISRFSNWIAFIPCKFWFVTYKKRQLTMMSYVLTKYSCWLTKYSRWLTSGIHLAHYKKNMLPCATEQFFAH